MPSTSISGIGNGELINWDSGVNLESVIDSKVVFLLNGAVGFSALVAVVILIASGYMFITSSGDPEKIEKAQKGVTAAIVGMVIVFLARMIIGFVLTAILKK